MSKSAHRFSLVNLVIAVAVGEFALVAIPALARRLYGGPAVLQWVIATAIIAVGSYLLFGVPQIAHWEASGPMSAPGDDVRFAWAIRLLERGGAATFIAASAVGGSPLIGWYWCARARSHPHRATFAAAWILAAVWSAIYLGLVSWLSWYVIPVVVGAALVLALASMVLRRTTLPLDG